MKHEKEWDSIHKEGTSLYYDSECLHIGNNHDEIIEQLVADFFGLSK